MHRGTYTTQAATKRGNRRAEFALRDTELWDALASRSGRPPIDVDELWKLLLLHQFHDIIPGSGIHWVYDDTALAHARILTECRRLVDGALESLVGGIDTEVGDHPVVVFNSLSHRRRELVCVEAPEEVTAAVGPSGVVSPVQRDADGRAVFEALVPPCGYQVYALTSGRPAPTGEVIATPTPSRTSTAHRARRQGPADVDRRQDRRRQVLAPGARGNRFQLHPDYPNFYDAWDIDRFAFDQVDDLDGVESIVLEEAGPLRAGIRVTRRFGDSQVTQLIRLDAGSRFIEFDTEVDWHETNRLLKVAFPVDVRSLRATYEIQYGHVERPTHANTSWDVARFEVCAHKWADCPSPAMEWPCSTTASTAMTSPATSSACHCSRATTWRPGSRSRPPPLHLPPPPPPGRPPDAGVIDAGYDLNVPLRVVPSLPTRGRWEEPGRCSLSMPTMWSSRW